MKTKEELFNELKEIGVTINDYSEKKYIGENSIGQRFYEGDEAWCFATKKGNWNKYAINRITIGYYSIIEKTPVVSEYYKTKQDAYRKMIEFAQGQGETIERFDSGEWRTSSNGWALGHWHRDEDHPENVYRIQPKKEYRPYTMEDDREHLRDAWIKTKTGGANREELMITYMSDARLAVYFRDYTFLDGSVIGVDIK